MFGSVRIRFALGAAAVLCLMGAGAWAQEAPRIADFHPIHIDSKGWSDVAAASTPTGQIYEISHPGATFIAVHFKRFHLAEGDYVIVSDADGGQSYSVEGKGKMNASTFWAQNVKGDTLVLEFVTAGEKPGRGFVIDQYSAGFVDLGLPFEAICGSNDLEDVVCYETSHPTEYAKSQAVARLVIMGGLKGCTGWLVSGSDRLITNEHCITSQTEATNTDFEFNAKTSTCPGTTCSADVYSGATLIKDNAALDYSLVEVNGNPSANYLHLEIDYREAVVGETIYLPAHPQGRCREFGIYCGAGTRCDVLSLTEPACTGATSYDDIGYEIDTEGGSSGSPVLAESNHKVVALHHCRGQALFCADPNRGVPIYLVYNDICDVMG